MAGPSCAVLIAAGVCSQADAVIESLVVAVGDKRDVSSTVLAFWVSTSRAIGGGYEGEARPFVCGYEPLCLEPAEIETLAAGFGFRPAHALAVGAMCNQPEDHRLLGEVATWLADQLSGVVQADGPLAPPAAMPGRVVGLPTGWGVDHVSDGPAMRGWLGCPAFHMIK